MGTISSRADSTMANNMEAKWAAMVTVNTEVSKWVTGNNSTEDTAKANSIWEGMDSTKANTGDSKWEGTDNSNSRIATKS